MAGTGYELTNTARVRSYVGGPKGGTVRIGDSMVPKHVTVEYESDDLMPDGRRAPRTVLEYEVRDGVPSCVEVRIVSRKGERPILAPDLSWLDVEQIGASAFARMAMRIVQSDGDSVTAIIDGVLHNESLREVKSAIPASYLNSHDELRHVARVYLDPMNRGKGTNAVLEVLGYNSRPTASRRVARARDAGLIPAPGATDAELDAALAKLLPTPPPPPMSNEVVKRRLRKAAGRTEGDES